MTDPNPATVAVPVELLERLLSEGFTITNVEEARALLPKPTPRLVAFDYGKWMEGSQSVEEYRDSQPDLLTLLDEAIDGIPTFGVESRDLVKSRIRAALGVTE